ncbi:ubiquitin-like protein [Glaciibacter superstes]|uniref:ubiquitin-like protein n=1 Tax=Glaciibacter superstes TaxID=501023 RepID=UPI0003B6A54C|nr:ubiquitin-like protein [Glaciibacter superstes]
MRKLSAAVIALALGTLLALGSTSAAFAMVMYVEISGADTLTLDVQGSDSVQQVKHKISEVAGFPVSDQVLLFESKVLEDGRTLADYNVQEGSTLVLLVTPQWIDDELGTPVLDEDYADAVTASGGGVSYAIAAGSLPVGVALDATTGEVSGVATAAGPYAFALTARNLAGAIEQDFSGEIAATTIPPVPDPAPAPEPAPKQEDHGEELAETGSPSPFPLVLAAAVALLLGVVLLASSRRVSRLATH